jgi:hypothetical protein
MPRGKKKCNSCGDFVGARLQVCHCGHIFSEPKAKTKKTPKPFFKERKEFIKRMLDGERSDCMKLDMMTATKIFQDFDNNLDFLTKVKPPFKLNKSIKYFLTKDGQNYLLKKKQEFDYVPPEQESVIDHEEKVGEDLLTNRTQTLRDFLNNE